MFIIGFCDDEKTARSEVRQLCELYFNKNEIEHQYIEFEAGEDVLEHCARNDGEQIDLLFLDIEMKELDGIRLKKQLLKQSLIWRIVFVTSHKDKVFEAFGQKTIGFILKPASYEQVEKVLNVVRWEKQENIEFELPGYKGEQLRVRMEDICYFKAAGSYTEVFTVHSCEEERPYMIISKKIGELEESMKQYPMARVHKSFLINLTNVVSVGDVITLKNSKEKISVGRKYKEQVKTAYSAYVSDRVKRRI